MKSILSRERDRTSKYILKDIFNLQRIATDDAHLDDLDIQTTCSKAISSVTVSCCKQKVCFEIEHENLCRRFYTVQESPFKNKVIAISGLISKCAKI